MLSKLLTMLYNHALFAGNLASVYFEQRNLDMAILNYRRAIAFDSGFLEAYNNLVCPIISFDWLLI